VNDPRLPVRSGPWHCRDARRHAAIFLILTFHWLESSSNSRATRRDPRGSRLRTIKRFSSRRLWQHRPAIDLHDHQ